MTNTNEEKWRDAEDENVKYVPVEHFGAFKLTVPRIRAWLNDPRVPHRMLKADLLKYGTEKRAAWERTRELLTQGR